MKKLLTIAFISVVSLAGMTGCAGNMPNAGNNDGFGILGVEESNTEPFGRMHNNFNGLLKDLNLNEAQKAQFKELKQSMGEQFKNNQGKRDELKSVLKESFLSTSIDKVALKAKLLSLKPQNDDRITLMANNLIKAYNILTPEQRTKVENKMNEMEKKMSGFMNNPLLKSFHGGPEKRIEKIAKNLNLTDSQKESFKALVKDGMPDREEMFKKAGKIKTEIQAELKSANPSPDKIKEILKGVKVGMEANIDKRLDKLVKVHDLLTPEQRQKLVENLEKRQGNFLKKMKSHFNR